MYVCNRFAIFPNVTLGKCQVQVIIENKQTPPKRVIKSRQTRVVILLISRLPTTFLRTPLQMSPLLLVVAVVFLVVSPSICFLTYTNQYFVIVVRHGLITLFFIDVFFLIFYCQFILLLLLFLFWFYTMCFLLHDNYCFCSSSWPSFIDVLQIAMGFSLCAFSNKQRCEKQMNRRTDRPRKIN